jgi:signal transduction histidine kinase
MRSATLTPSGPKSKFTTTKRQLRMRIRDDGKRISQDSGCGMQERAALLNGKLSILNGPNCGTEVELTISAAIA